MNQYEDLLHSQWGDRMHQILQVKEKTIPVKHNHKVQPAQMGHTFPYL